MPVKIVGSSGDSLEGMNYETSQRVKNILIDGANQFSADAGVKFIDIEAAIHKPATILPDHKGWLILIF